MVVSGFTPRSLYGRKKPWCPLNSSADVSGKQKVSVSAVIWTSARPVRDVVTVLSSCGAAAPVRGLGCLTVEVSRSETHHTRYDFSGWGIIPTKLPLPDPTQHSQDTDIYASGGIRTRNPTKRAAADLRLRPITVRLYGIIPLKMNRRPLYLKTKSVPRSKHFSSRL